VVNRIGREKLLAFYRDHIVRQVLPFWTQAVDRDRGGVYTCYTNGGESRVSTDKYTWSQGRFLWLWSRLAAMCADGRLEGDAEAYLEDARKTYAFLRRHAILPNGNCAFLLTEDGTPKEPEPGRGLDTSFYADCFVVMGMAEYARVAGDREALDTAAALFESVERRIAEGTARSEPYPIPSGCAAHGYAMILLNTAQELALASARLAPERTEPLRRTSTRLMDEILTRFRDRRNRIREIVRSHSGADGEEPQELLLRHLNPGHTVESMWFVLREAKLAGREDAALTALDVLKRALETGWDDEYGGLYRYVDLNGGAPTGSAWTEGTGASRFESLISGTWDMKLWWPHSEALFATLLGYLWSGDAELADWYERLHQYVFGLFPAAPGREWVQIRARDGTPVQQVVALPVKDPYHILRNLMLIVSLLQEWDPAAPFAG